MNEVGSVELLFTLQPNMRILLEPERGLRQIVASRRGKFEERIQAMITVFSRLLRALRSSWPADSTSPQNPVRCGQPSVCAIFNCWAMWRAAKVSRPYPTESIAHIAVDVCILACLIAKIGGAMNPFGSLFVLPIALVTVALPPLWVGVTAVLCCVGYALSSFLDQSLPHIHSVLGNTLTGKWCLQTADPQTSESGR